MSTSRVSESLHDDGDLADGEDVDLDDPPEASLTADERRRLEAISALRDPVERIGARQSLVDDCVRARIRRPDEEHGHGLDGARLDAVVAALQRRILGNGSAASDTDALERALAAGARTLVPTDADRDLDLDTARRLGISLRTGAVR